MRDVDVVTLAKQAAVHDAWRTEERRQTDAVLRLAILSTPPTRQKALASRIRQHPYPR